MNTRIWFLMAGILALSAWLTRVVAEDVPPPDPTPPGLEVEARGPVHEAYAQPIDTRPLPSVVAPKAPPALLDELPPEQKPQGDVQWLPGYWAWEDEKQDYLWVSGLWRVPPPNRQWVPGSWQAVQDGWQWTAGFWAAKGLTEVEYLPAPPPNMEADAVPAAPNDNCTYAPGCWVYREKKYYWRHGFWVNFQPGWVWIPAHYLWTPGGYVFVAGYWDHLLQDRGLLFAPVRILDRAAVTTYTPSFVVQPDFLIGALFVRPNYCHYYFGDFFDVKYKERGFVAWCDYHPVKSVFDPSFAYYRQQYRADPGWERNLRALYVGRSNGTLVRPPHTLGQQNTLIKNITNSKTENVLIHKDIHLTNIQNVHALGSVTRFNNTRVTNLSALATKPIKVENHVIKVENVTKEQRTELHTAVQPYRQAAQTRHAVEAKMLTEGHTPVRVNDSARTVKIEVPKAPAVRVEPPRPVFKEVPKVPVVPRHEERVIPAHEAPKFPRPVNPKKP